MDVRLRPRLVRRIASLLLVALLLLGIYWTFRMAWADLLFEGGTQESASRAVALVPDNAEYRAGRADWGSPERVKDLQAAVVLDPHLSSAWIELGLIAESENDFARAQRYLEEAGRVDKTFAPRWTLANYYYRRSNSYKFWEWSRRALEMSDGDSVALYRLCWLFSEDPREILSRVIPDTSDHLVRYLLYLLKENRLGPAAAVAQRLIPKGGLEHKAILLNYCDQLVVRGELDAALGTWNNLIRYRVLPFDPLDPGAGKSLTNGGFGSFPCSRGFDWRVVENRGVWLGAGTQSGLKINFSGRQAERCQFLLQDVPVAPGTVYRLDYTYKTTGVPPESGLRWRFRDRPDAPAQFVESPDMYRQDWGADSVTFRTDPGAGMARLTLQYDRATGTMPPRGTLELKQVALTPVK